MNRTYISRESPVGFLEQFQIPLPLPDPFVAPPDVNTEATPTYDIQNRSVLSYVFGFDTYESGYEPLLLFCSAMAIIPVIGGVFSLLSCSGRGCPSFY